MKEFNENPFKKDTEVRPFSNGTEAMVWHENNCDKCKNYSPKAESEEGSKCKLAWHIDVGYILGSIPLHVAKDIGCTYDPLYGSCHLRFECRMRQIEGEEFPF